MVLPLKRKVQSLNGFRDVDRQCNIQTAEVWMDRLFSGHADNEVRALPMYFRIPESYPKLYRNRGLSRDVLLLLLLSTKAFSMKALY